MLKLKILDVNYRSTKNVVNFVNDVFMKVPSYEYYAQSVHSDINGLVEITPFYLEDEEKFINIKNKLLELLEKGINPKNIAILTYTNKDVMGLYEYLSKEFNELKIITEVTSKLINQNNVKSCINLVKYYYFNEDIYKSNFNALLGNKIDSKVELILNIKELSLEEQIKEIATFYKLIDENFLKFIETISAYEDIVEFVYNIDNNEESMVNKDTSGLQILTVFKSKGLEFDTVMVLDRISKKNSDKSSLLFDYEDIKLNKIYYKNKIRENFDEAYYMAIEKEKNLSLNDERNILYVALTRAKNNMIIFKKEKDSVFDNLRVDFSNKTIGELYINKENKNSMNTIQGIEYTPMDLGIQEVLKNDNTQTAESIKAKYFGIATHSCLEMMLNFDLDSLEFSLKLVKSKFMNYLEEEDFSEIKNRIKMLLEEKSFLEIIDNSKYTKEQPLMYNGDVKIIDLLIHKENKYIIVDYKTTKDKLPSHKKQVNFYKKAISSITKSNEVIGYVVYLQKDLIEIISID